MLEAFDWIRERAPDAAVRWYDALENALQSLGQFPERCALAAENDAFEEEIRQLLFGKDHGTYRVLFTVRGDEVHVLHFRHTARLPLEGG